MEYKTYSDSYLKTMTKDALIRQLRCTEHNLQVARETIEQQYANVKDWSPTIHGHWILADSGQFKNSVSICSECGKRYLLGNIGYNYCPECGARMDGDSE